MKKYLFASIIFFVCVTSLDAQSLHWQPTNGPFSGYINCYTANSNYIYAGTSDSDGLYRSSDNGVTWSWIGNGLTLPGVTLLAANGASIFAGYNGYGVGYGIFQSTDSGNTWSQVTSLTSANVTALAANNTACFAATDVGFFRSSDNGITWDTISGPSGVQSIAIQDSLIVVGESGGVAISLNNGNTWKSSMFGYYFQPLSASSVGIENSILFASTDSGLFRSTNLGAYWEKISEMTFGAFASIDTTIFVDGVDGVLRSTDQGNSWQSVGDDTDYWYATALCVKDSTIFIGVEDLGNYYSKDRGTHWIKANTGMSNVDISGFVNIGQTVFAGTVTRENQDGRGVCYTSDMGNNWQLSSQDDGFFINVACLAAIGNTLFAGTYGDGILSSTDSGVSWNWIAAPGDSLFGPAVLLSHDSTLFAAGEDYGLFRSVDDGASWVNLDSLIGFYPDFMVTCGSAIVASYGTSAGNEISTDDGLTWTQLPDSFNSRFISALAANSTTLFAGIYDYDAVTDGVAKSTDGGVSWSFTSIRDPVYALYATDNVVLASTSSSVYASPPSTIYLSTNDGETWSKQNDGLDSAYCFTIVGNYIYAGTSAGVYVTPFNIDAVSPNTRYIPSATLSVFPNPLISSATLHYYLASPSSVTISIFDALGRQVASPVIGEEQDAGDHQATLDAHGLAPGVYTCRLIANAEEQSAKVVVTR